MLFRPAMTMDALILIFQFEIFPFQAHFPPRFVFNIIPFLRVMEMLIAQLSLALAHVAHISIKITPYFIHTVLVHCDLMA